MTAASVMAAIEAVEAIGGRLFLNGDVIEVEAAEGTLSPSVVHRLRVHKADLLILLRDRPVCQICGSLIASPVTHWWGGDPVHGDCGIDAWRRSVAGTTVAEHKA